MSVSSFDQLLSYITDYITRKSTRFGLSIPAEERLAMTLRFLARGNSFTSRSFEYRMGRTTVGEIVRETCNVIWEKLKEKIMKIPTTKEWEEISKEFNMRSNFSNCFGALDGKHIRIAKPEGSGSQLYNCKHYFSIVLMALFDANYCFRVIDIGHYGKQVTQTFFRKLNLYKMLMDGTLNVPNPKPLPGYEDKTPMSHVIVADEAFAINTDVVRPYPRQNLNIKKRVFNYRLSRARRFVECTFGILANKWRVFHTTINLQPEFVEFITLAFVRIRDGYQFEDSLTCTMEDISVVGTGGSSRRCKMNRDIFAEYFTSSAGCIPWQYDVI